MVHSPLTDGVRLTSDSSVRNHKVDRFIVHHAATTSLAAILSLFQPGGRTVSANYALGNDGTLVHTVDERRRAWTSASSVDDGRAITIEVANSYAGAPWPVSDASFHKLARLIADVSTRYGFPINDSTVLTHQELYRRFGRSYPTACPGDMQRRKAELLQLAIRYQKAASSPAGGGGVIVPEEEPDMAKQYPRRYDGRKGGFQLAPAEKTQLKHADGRDMDITESADSGRALLTGHVYAKGEPGDAIDVQFIWYKIEGGHASGEYVTRVEFDKNGVANVNHTAQGAKQAGYRIFLRVQAPSSNAKSLSVTTLTADAAMLK